MRFLSQQRRRTGCGVLASTLILASMVSAQEVAEIPFSSSPLGSAALGGGLRISQSPYLPTDNGDRRQLDLVPLFHYEGKVLFARGIAGGVHLFRNDSIELNLLARFRFQKLDPTSNEYYAGLDERKQSLDAGLSFAVRRPWGEINLDWVTDTLNRHGGEEARISYRYNIESGPWTYSPFIAWSWQDDDLSNYYFGVSEDEANPERPAYRPGNSQRATIGLNTGWQVSDRTVFFANVGFGFLDTEVEDSPLTKNDSFTNVFVGATYLMGNAVEPDYIMDTERVGEWSWRVNYGYQAEGNIVGEIDQGDLTGSDIVDTNIGGLTFGKLLAQGKRADVSGRVAWYRHFEQSEGNGDFSSYAAYIMVIGSGYSQWTSDELFRWGFGFGMSYAHDVPIAEQYKQDKEGDNTSHFLNYLEMTLDYPLRRASKARWLQNCYAGLTIVHRSGIFGSSDLLGEVSGGSDWLTAHLECKR